MFTEEWLYKNKKALESVKRGLSQKGTITKTFTKQKKNSSAHR